MTRKKALSANFTSARIGRTNSGHSICCPSDLLAARHQPGFWFGRQRGYMAVGHSGTGQPRPRHTVGDYRAGNGDRSCLLQG